MGESKSMCGATKMGEARAGVGLEVVASEAKKTGMFFRGLPNEVSATRKMEHFPWFAEAKPSATRKMEHFPWFAEAKPSATRKKGWLFSWFAEAKPSATRKMEHFPWFAEAKPSATRKKGWLFSCRFRGARAG